MAAWERCLFGVVPSLWPDPLPGVVREPMTRGRPVIGSDVGGIPDMITDDVNGLLVPAGDAAALASAMDRLVADPALRARLGEAGRRVGRRPDAGRHRPRFEALYDRVLDPEPDDDPADPHHRRAGEWQDHARGRLHGITRAPVHELDLIARIGGGNGPERPTGRA